MGGSCTREFGEEAPWVAKTCWRGSSRRCSWSVRPSGRRRTDGRCRWPGGSRRRCPRRPTSCSPAARASASCAPYLGIPWRLLPQHGHWLVGDGFSGQFRLAAAVLRPQPLTFLDDGANAIAFADALARPSCRTRVRASQERGLTTPSRRSRSSASTGARRGARRDVHRLRPRRRPPRRPRRPRVRHPSPRFEWTRATAPAAPALGRAHRARAARGRSTAAWSWSTYVRGCGMPQPAAPSLPPHRRETAEQLRRGRAGSRHADLVGPACRRNSCSPGRGSRSSAHAPVEHHHDAAARARGHRRAGVHGCREPERRRAPLGTDGGRMSEVVAIIPARGGSKGVPRKNLRRVGGVPLVARAVDAARRCPAIDRVVVTTDDAEIAAVAARVGRRGRRAARGAVGRPGVQRERAAACARRARGAQGRRRRRGLPAGDVAVHRRRRARRRPCSSCDRAGATASSRRWRPTASSGRRASATPHGPVNHEIDVRPRRQDREPHYLETGAFYVMRCRGIPRRPAPVLRERRHRRGRTDAPRSRSTRAEELELARRARAARRP